MSDLPKSDPLKPDQLSVYEQTFNSEWMKTFIKFDPSTLFNKIDCPVLALFGEKDLQVLPKLNGDVMKKKFDECNKTNYKIKIFKDANV